MKHLIPPYLGDLMEKNKFILQNNIAVEMQW